MTSRPTATYRLQLGPGFGFREVAGLVDYLAALGVSHVYLSPILQAAPGSSHGYDVVDHARLSGELGGEEGWAALQAALHRSGLGVVVDVVPNHMAIPLPESGNAPFWSVLELGSASPFASWFDIEWQMHDGKILLPILGAPLETAIDDLRVEDGELAYFDHRLPLAPGSEHLSMDELLGAQHYRLAFWRDGERVLNYRRFFDISTLIALRVEDPEVFRATHERLLRMAERGELDGLRIDHPDGLADPRGYLRSLGDRANRHWIVVEKILEPGEALPADWPCDGTTGYDAAHVVTGLFVDPSGADELTRTYVEVTGAPADYGSVLEQAKREVLEEVLTAELHRLVELLVRATGEDRPALQSAAVELLVAIDVYRAYVVPGEKPSTAAVETIQRALATARRRRPELVRELMLISDLALGRWGRGPELDEMVVRFGQTTGPLMAKGGEDTALYRWHRLAALNEVGGDPAVMGVGLDAFHRFAAERLRHWPRTMTALTTHDTKRSEDVRARISVLSEIPEEWRDVVLDWDRAADRYRAAGRTGPWPDRNLAYLLWQTLVGAWPISAERLLAYAIKAAREAKRETSWTDPDAAYEAAVRSFLRGVLADESLMGSVAAFVERIRPAAVANVLSARLVQLTMPGIPDTYQGTELEARWLVDPDNRREVDFHARRGLLAQLDAMRSADVEPADDHVADVDRAKLLVVSQCLRLRRERPAAFAGTYRRLAVVGPAADHLVAFTRDGVVAALATRLTERLRRTGGWQETAVTLAAGTYHDLLSGTQLVGGSARVADVLQELPVALLVRQ